MKSEIMHKPFEIEIVVLDSDIDQLGHVNNVVYLRWVQDVAVAHWQHGATEEDQNKILWVVTRHEIDYKRSAMKGDTIIAKTCVGAAEKRSFERLTQLRRKSDDKVLAEARTFWCPIDSITKHPIKPTEEHYRKFSTNYNH